MVEDLGEVGEVVKHLPAALDGDEVGVEGQNEAAAELPSIGGEDAFSAPNKAQDGIKADDALGMHLGDVDAASNGVEDFKAEV